MKYTLAFYSFLVLLFVSQSDCFALPPVQPDGLRCEYLTNPLGIDNPTPRLTWFMKDSRKGAKQTAYQVLVDTDSAKVANETGSEWNTGKVVSGNSLVVYKGKALQPFTKYYWKVVIWDKDGVKAAQAAVNSFEMGMMQMRNWKGAWISDSRDVKTKPAPYFRKSFSTAKT